MNLVFEHIVSREFWRKTYPLNRAPRNPMMRPRIDSCAASRESYFRLAPEWARNDETLRLAKGTTHCLVFDPGAKMHSPHHIAHSWSAKLPRGSLYKLSEGLFVSSPEFTFLQLASHSDVRELIAYGNELCGLYAFDRTTQRGFRTRSVPLITTRQLANYLHDARGCRGYKRSMRALKHIVDKSASPMESAVEMLNCLPAKKLGGYGIERPSMNEPITLNAQAARIAQRSTCYADICYPTIKLDIEYHGRFDHDDAESFDSDRARVNGLIEMGYEVIEITSDQVNDLMRFEAIVQHVARRLGKPIRRENLGYLHERLLLREIAFEWNRSSGTPAFLR